MKLPRLSAKEIEALDDSPRSCWKVSRRAWSRASEARWVKVATLHRPDAEVGLSDDGRWVRGGGTLVSVADSRKMLVGFLPILEMSRSRLQVQLREGLARIDLSQEIAETFPLEAIANVGILSGSEYWASLAILRLSEIPTLSKDSIESLSEAAKQGPTQRIRHSARKLLSQRNGAV